MGPQEYTLIKMRVLELKGKLAALEGQGPVFLMAATLRPETMYGQTNAWALPEGDYAAFRGLNGEVRGGVAGAHLRQHNWLLRRCNMNEWGWPVAVGWVGTWEGSKRATVGA